MVVCCLCIDLTCTYSPTPQQAMCRVPHSTTVILTVCDWKPATAARRAWLRCLRSHGRARLDVSWIVLRPLPLNNWSVHQLNGRPVPGAPVTASQKPHEHGPMRRPQSRGDSRESHRTPKLGSRSFRLERPARRHLDVLKPDHVETSVLASAVMGRAWGRRRSAP
jgi:hypothetical protein